MKNDQKKTAKGGKLDGQTRLLLTVNGLFVTAGALSGTFLGVYIWKASRDFVLLGWFTLIGHLVMGLTFWLAGNGVKEGDKMLRLRLGIGCSALFYASVLLLGNRAIDYIVLLGALHGLSNGLFWLAFNVVYFEVTEADTRDRFNGLAGVTGSLAGMAAPWLSGFVISRMGGESGYRTIFIASLGIFVVGVLVSLRLRNRRTDGEYDWRMPVKAVRTAGSAWRPVGWALVAQGAREGVFGIVIGVLVYVATGSELLLGNFALITSGVGFVTFYAVGKWLKPKWRKTGMLVGTVGITAVILPFFWDVNFKTLLAFGIGVAIFMPLFVVPMTSSVFDMIGMSDDGVRYRVEYVVVRELSLNVGRIAGMAAFIATMSATAAPLALNVFMFTVGAAPIVSWLFMRNRLNVRGTGRETAARVRRRRLADGGWR